jgi:DNA-binding transcriptional ArsR family regulator
MVTEQPASGAAMRSGPRTAPRTAFDAIADPTRRAILDHLRGGELAAGEIARRFPVSRPAVAKHVRVLREAGLLKQRRQAQTIFYALDPKGLVEVDRWLQPYRLFWAARLQNLKSFVEAAHQADEAAKKDQT